MTRLVRSMERRQPLRARAAILRGVGVDDRVPSTRLRRAVAWLDSVLAGQATATATAAPSGTTVPEPAAGGLALAAAAAALLARRRRSRAG